MNSYEDADVVCPFYLKSDKGFIQCEGIEENTAIRILYRNAEKGCALTEDKKKYMELFCKNDFSKCFICRMLEGRYE